ncbi:MAG: MarR family transcriptional regulator [Pseudolabrys sp.]|nr:MarR family transcriptional regulator [Pseudolabrys sp.]
MTDRPRNAAGTALSLLILDVFRLNGRLLAEGDRLVGDLGLTSARWQVLGAIALAPAPQPVAWIARSMGLYRQGVQRIVNEMVQEGFVVFADNPHHRRAKLVTLTAKGRTAFAAADQRQKPWVNALAKGLNAGDLATTQRVLMTLRDRLDENAQSDA